MPSLSWNNRGVSRARAGRFAYLLWVFVILAVFVVMPGVMSCTFLPKMFWACMAIGVGLALLRPAGPCAVAITPLAAIWLAYLLWALLSLLWAPQPFVGLDRWVALLVPTLGYVVARRTRFWESDAFWLIFCVIVGAEALLGVVQYMFPDSYLAVRIPGAKVPQATEGSRAYAVMLFTVTLPFLAWRYFKDEGWRCVVSLASLGVVILFVLLAKTRGAWLGLAVAAVFALASGVTPKLLHRRGRLLVLLGAALLAVVAVSVTTPPRQFLMWGGSEKRTLLSTLAVMWRENARVAMWREALSTVNPWGGNGFGNYPIAPRKNGAFKYLNYEVHNDYLQAFVDLGTPGAALYTLIFLAVIRLGWRNRKNGVALAGGTAAVGLAVLQGTTFTTQVVTSILWMSGVAAILNSHVQAWPVSRRKAPAWLAAGFNYALAVWLFAFAVVIGFAIWGDHEFRTTENLVGRLQQFKTVLKTPDKYPKATVEQCRLETPAMEEQTRLQMRRLVADVLPRMRFGAYMIQMYCHFFTIYSANLKEWEATYAFSREAVFLHPTDPVCVNAFTQLSASLNRLPEAIGVLNKGVRLFGYNPYLPICGELSWAYEKAGDAKKAAEVNALALANAVAKPGNPQPKNRASDAPAELSFKWDECRGATHYNLYVWRAGEEEPLLPQAFHLTKSEARLSVEARYGATYLWRVEAVGKYGSAESEPFFFRTVQRPL